MCLILEGYNERMREQKRGLAWAVAYLLQPHLKEGKTLTPAQLLGEKEPRGSRKRAKEERWLTSEDAQIELERLRAAQASDLERAGPIGQALSGAGGLMG